MHLSKACELEDFHRPEAAEVIRFIEADLARAHPAFPRGREHRKSWEYQQIWLGLESLGALRDDARLLVTNAGGDQILFALTRRAGAVFAVDRYDHILRTNPGGSCLFDPNRFVRTPVNLNRLVLQNMDPRFLRFDADSFDAVVAMQFSAYAAERDAGLALLEVERVLKPGGIAILSAELVVNDAEPLELPDLCLHTAHSLYARIGYSPGLHPVDDFVADVSPATAATCIPFSEVLRDLQLGVCRYPHIVLEMEGRRFTSATVFLRKGA